MRWLHPLLALLAVPAQAGTADLRLTLPPHWHAVEGVPISLYFDNIVLTEHQDDSRFEVACGIGTTEEKRWTGTPAKGQAGEHPLRITVRDASGAVLQTASTVLHVAPAQAGAGRSVRLLIIGDSLTHATAYPNEIARLLSPPGNPSWTMLGTHRPPSAAPGVAHEGYGGWTWAAFLTKWDPQPAGATAGPLARKSTSPFLFPGPAGEGQLDLPRYFQDVCGNQPPDVITFLLGINDCFSAPPDDPAALDARITTVLGQADALLAAFHSAAPRATLAVGLTTPPNARESGFLANYQGKYPRWGWKRIQHRLVERMISHFANRESDGIHLVATQINLDPWDGYPENNGVHPNPTGYAQIGASFYAWLKNWLHESSP